MILARENSRFQSWDERAEILLKIFKIFVNFVRNEGYGKNINT